MAEPNKIKEFPQISNKLIAPTKKSLFERQKAEAEAKRQREEAETAAVYDDFVKSFEGGSETGTGPATSTAPVVGPPAGSRGGGFGGVSKRHFAPSGPRGSSGPGSLGPPPSLSRKRNLDGSFPPQKDREHGLFAFENSAAEPLDAAAAFQESDEEDAKASNSRTAERVPPKPTLHLSSLPPGTSSAVIKSLFPGTLVVDAVRVLPPSGPGSTERKSMSAIVTLAKDTPASDIENVIISLQHRYLGWGHYLSLSRHLSSAALGSMALGNLAAGSGAASLPFGARPVPIGPGPLLSRAPPPDLHGRGFAPPSSYLPSGAGQFGRGQAPVQVNIAPPSDIKQLKLIHKTIEALITHGPEFEALLMSRHEVQRHERWAWLWDPRSAGGIWYRWRLWQIVTGLQAGNQRPRYSDPTSRLFDSGASWLPPEKSLPFEFITHFDEFVSDPEYDSSEEDESGDEGRERRHNHGGAPPEGVVQEKEMLYLNPLQKAKLTHLLARLPTTTAKLRKGDVARVMAFAINHAGEGADEIVDMIVSNIERPFALTSANVDRVKVDEVKEPQTQGEDTEKRHEREDPSSSKLIALYIVSDILSSSSTSGVRHAWRYRQLFESALKNRKVFEGLGRLEKDLQWGRLRAEKWKRSVNVVLSLWESWCVFPQTAQEHFLAVFTNPPPTLAEQQSAAAEAAAKLKVGVESSTKSKWKSVDADNIQQDDHRNTEAERIVSNSNGAPTVVFDGEPMDEDDVDGEPMEDVDGEPMDEDMDGEPMNEDDNVLRNTQVEIPSEDFEMKERKDVEPETDGSKPRRRRPKAEDMFADSDED